MAGVKFHMAESSQNSSWFATRVISVLEHCCDGGCGDGEILYGFLPMENVVYFGSLLRLASFGSVPGLEWL